MCECKQQRKIQKSNGNDMYTTIQNYSYVHLCSRLRKLKAYETKFNEDVGVYHVFLAMWSARTLCLHILSVLINVVQVTGSPILFSHS